MHLRGGEKRLRRTDSSKGVGAGSQATPNARGAVASSGLMSVNIRKRLQDKLTSLGNRRRILHSYTYTWAKTRESDGARDARVGRGELDEAAKRLEVNDEDMQDANQSPSTGVLDSRNIQGFDTGVQVDACTEAGSGKRNETEQTSGDDADNGSGPDAILRNMSRTGLCGNGELDSRVQAFMIKLKKQGKRAALVSALVKFREHLMRPQSRQRRVRNKSAVLTHLLLSAQREHESQLPDAAQALPLTCDDWSRDLCHNIEAVDGIPRSAAALRDSVFQVAYPTAVAQRVLRGDREHRVALRIDRMAHLMFVGVIAKSCTDGQGWAQEGGGDRGMQAQTAATSEPAASPFAWWGSPLMTGKVAYVVSNGRCLDGASLVSASRVTFQQGDTLVLVFSAKNRSVAFFKRTGARELHEGEEGGQVDGLEGGDLLIGSVGNLSGRVRVAAQLKSKGDSVSIIPLPPPAPPPAVAGALAAGITVSNRGRKQPPTDSREPPPTHGGGQGHHLTASGSVRRDGGAEEPASAGEGGKEAHGSAPLNASAPPVERDAYTAPFGGRKVFVGGTRQLDSEELQEYFESKFGAVATVKTAQTALPDGATAPRGFAFVTFLDARHARRAIKAARATYKKGSAFARMEMKACDGALRKQDNEYDRYTAAVLREADERREQERRAAHLAAMTPLQRRLLESKAERTPVVALDCEMVGVGSDTGRGRGRRSVLARVCVVNSKGETLYSRFVQPEPQDEVTDFRARITGLSAANLTAQAGAVPYQEARGVVAALLHRRVVVGHALRNDFKVLGIRHPVSAVRDTARYRPLRLGAGLPLDDGQGARPAVPSLKALAARLLGRQIQVGRLAVSLCKSAWCRPPEPWAKRAWWDGLLVARWWLVADS